jgi:hypothetical protein
MSLRGSLDLVPETVQEFDIAASEKLTSGQALIVAGDSGAAIYLLGYSAEMLLKNAYFRLTGAALADEIESRLKPARSSAKGSHMIPNISDESYYSL